MAMYFEFQAQERMDKEARERLRSQGLSEQEIIRRMNDDRKDALKQVAISLAASGVRKFFLGW